MQVVIDNILCHYERSGSGPTILILPGWADTSRSWFKLQSMLDENYDVIVLDFPGFGGSQEPPMHWEISDFAIFVEKFISKLSLQSIDVIIGHSNGGAVAIRALAMGRIRTQKLILVASAGIRNQHSFKGSVVRAMTKVGKVLTFPLPGRVKVKLRARLYENIGSDMLVAPHMEGIFKKIIREDVRTDAQKIHVPTLLIYGDADNDTPLSFAHIFNELIVGSKLEIIKDGGHFLHTNNTDALLYKVKEFIHEK